jgi:hypothetical protein
LPTVLTTTADQAAAATGFVRRRRRLSGATFTPALVFGWLDNPQATLEDLAQAAATVGAPVSPQALDQRFTPQAADCLRATLGHAVTQALAAQPAAVPLLRRFAGASLLDSTSFALPDALADLFPGCGGRTPQSGRAALKVQVRWEWSGGALDGLTLHPGRATETHSPLSLAPLPPGSLRLADPGYFDLDVFAAYSSRGAYWLSRLQAKTAVYAAGARVRDLAAWLAGRAGGPVDVAVAVGSRQRLACRLLALRVPEAVAQKRRQRLREKASKKGRTPHPEQLALCAWTIWITNVPAEQLTVTEAWVLSRCRWQIELLFKLWKSHGEIDQSRSRKPYRVLCEVYAKLLALVVQHWVLLASGGTASGRSLRKAARKVRQHALHLASVLGVKRQLQAALRLIQRCLRQGCRVQKRKKKPSTYQLLLDPSRVSLN